MDGWTIWACLYVLYVFFIYLVAPRYLMALRRRETGREIVCVFKPVEYYDLY